MTYFLFSVDLVEITLFVIQDVEVAVNAGIIDDPTRRQDPLLRRQFCHLTVTNWLWSLQAV